MVEALVLRGTMEGHSDHVTAIATPIDNSDMIVSTSRDKSILLWHLTKDTTNGVRKRHLTGHSHFVQDVVISSDGQFALSGSWDGELRLWDLILGLTTRQFVGHSKMFSVWHSPLTIVRSFQPRGIAPSSSGTLWVSANILFRLMLMGTLIGSAVSASVPLLLIPLLCLDHGIALSRSGTSPTAYLYLSLFSGITSTDKASQNNSVGGKAGLGNLF